MLRSAARRALAHGRSSATAPAQPPADFSGRWTLDAPAIATTPAVPGTPAAAAAPGDMGSGWGSTITIAQDANRLSVEYTFFSRYDLQPPLTFTYPLDGSVGRNTVMMGRGEQIESSRAQWNGQTLVIITTFHIADRGAGKPFTAELTRKLSVGIADDPGRGSDPRRRARRASFHDALGLSKGLRSRNPL